MGRGKSGAVESFDCALKGRLIVEAFRRHIDSVFETMRVLVLSLYHLARRVFHLVSHQHRTCLTITGQPSENSLTLTPMSQLLLNNGSFYIFDEEPHPFMDASVESEAHPLTIDYSFEHGPVLQELLLASVLTVLGCFYLGSGLLLLLPEVSQFLVVLGPEVRHPLH